MQIKLYLTLLLLFCQSLISEVLRLQANLTLAWKERESCLQGQFSLGVFLSEDWGAVTLVLLALKLIWLILPPAQAGVQCPTDRWTLYLFIILFWQTFTSLLYILICIL